MQKLRNQEGNEYFYSAMLYNPYSGIQLLGLSSNAVHEV